MTYDDDDTISASIKVRKNPLSGTPIRDIVIQEIEEMILKKKLTSKKTCTKKRN